MSSITLCFTTQCSAPGKMYVCCKPWWHKELNYGTDDILLTLWHGNFCSSLCLSQTRSRWHENENELVITRCDKQDSHSMSLHIMSFLPSQGFSLWNLPWPLSAWVSGYSWHLALAFILQSKDRTCKFGWLVTLKSRKMWVRAWFSLELTPHFCAVKGIIQSKLHNPTK